MGYYHIIVLCLRKISIFFKLNGVQSSQKDNKLYREKVVKKLVVGYMAFDKHPAGFNGRHHRVHTAFS